ncbi:NFX1-type zinc finger-containing protein 1-like [Copidosoma floridanum]|uniref:NFX1-type zinc finger-containing protein 1-like n=1 Tax=Copidosoma floridanum TaxID=29053 RepID=UPI0006C9AAE7|nr:NFX1-type zinc finger-containing protein 1-like [Copidosoma floridanum]
MEGRNSNNRYKNKAKPKPYCNNNNPQGRHAKSTGNERGHQSRTLDPRRAPNPGFNKPIAQNRWNKRDNDRCAERMTFNFKSLKELSLMNSEDAMVKVTKNQEEFANFLNKKMRPDFLVVTLKVFKNICRANFTETLTKLINQACSSNFLHNLENYLTKLPFESTEEKLLNKLYYEDVNGFWRDLVEFFQKIIELMFRTACNKLTTVLKKMEGIIQSIELTQKYGLDDGIKKDVSSMIKDLEGEIKKIEKRDVVGADSDENSKELAPPDNFREINVFPTTEDLLDDKVFLRSCKIKDPYDSVDHYLDVQFRLLREDFVRPLRNGIKELDGTQNYRNNDFRIYRNVRLMTSNVKEFSAGIQLNFGKLNFVDWRISKRLMYGALLLLSNDNFKNVVFATVSNRDIEDLMNGFVSIEPCVETVINPTMYNCNLVLLESKIFFEPYFVVLSAMQKINETNFPMERYLIQAKTSVKLPRYLEDVNYLTFEDKFMLPLHGGGDWPPAAELTLDESQYGAFKSALTQEFAVIQGPPGTGKTFIALKIVRALLENSTKWKKHGPIVVVCLTNHALDQFLEGILRYTKSIVRVGSRSKSQKLKPYALGEIRKSFNHRNSAGYLVHDMKRQIEEVFRAVDKLRLFIKYLTTPNIIVPLQAFQNCRDETPLKEFKTSEELMFWLVGMEVTPLIGLETPSDAPNNVSEEAKKEETAETETAKYIFEELDNLRTDVDITFEYEKLKVVDSWGQIYPLDMFDRRIKETQCQISQLKNNPASLHLPFSPINAWTDHLEDTCQQRENIRLELSKHPLINKTSAPTANPRWQKYWSWITTSYDWVCNKITQLEEKYRSLNSQLSEMRHIADLGVMKEREVVGLTTTCAAKIQSSLRALRAPIVLVEEAAEILESHVVCAMTKSCQHVILIGDHKQLRPKASVYELGTKYNLNVSLFERMVNVRGDCIQLAYQHRMRPQIAKLVSPIYEILHNDKSVFCYPNVKGLDKNLFFLNHTSREESCKIDESYVNKHEVRFFAAFARHLLMQGYGPDDITILCTYTGQLIAFMNEVHRHSLLRQVRVTTVDNYQGEENKIILLSLVRNNGESKVGFLKEENRVCVALSRAREGLYIMGNMSDLISKNNIWPKVHKVLEDENAIGDYLKLRCQIHKDQFFEVKNEDDFKQCPEGGCLKKCDLLLPCGHFCLSVCHILDREHKNYQCKQNCNGVCPNNHPCELKCWQGCKPCLVFVECTLKCGHTIKIPCSSDPNTFPCPVKVDATLPECNHAITKPCYLSIEECKCSYKCETRLDCGHSCLKYCHVKFDPDHLKYTCNKNCTRKNVNCTGNHICKKRCYEECEPCSLPVDKKRSCRHYYKNVACSLNIEDAYCERRCDKIMICGHKCKLKCSDECNNCQQMVTKKSPCGHNICVKCCEEATPSKCNFDCLKTLPCGHPCTKKCRESCTMDCKEMVKLNKPGLCGHIFSVPCYLKNSDPKSHGLLRYCKEPCNFTLACTHTCKGDCGSCFQGRMHVACSEPCRTVFICGHSCKVACNLECQPCTQKCELKCSHNKCGRKCGVPCVPCKEPCERKCFHQQCEKLCYEICDITPCDKPCRKRLKCHHACVGFCGEPCPPLCRICHEDELTEIFFGHEDDPDARFVLLNDCGHCFENEGLMQWIQPTTDTNEAIEVKTPACPKCKTPIRSCNRIMNRIKEDLKNVMAVKDKLFFSNKKDDIARKRKKNVEALRNMENFPIIKDFRDIKNYIFKLKEVNNLDVIVSILEEIITVLKKKKNLSIPVESIKLQVTTLIQWLPGKLKISNQRLDDVQLELRRLHLMVYIYNLFSDDLWKLSECKKDYDLLMEKLTNVGKFTLTVEADIINSSKILNERKTVLIERAMIVKAMGLAKGHWYKCPNNHVYAIGQCGGAMERSKCIECKAVIGGENHRLVQGNALATEIDGALRPAWPTALRY